jgi:hypothetical protein
MASYFLCRFCSFCALRCRHASSPVLFEAPDRLHFRERASGGPDVAPPQAREGDGAPKDAGPFLIMSCCANSMTASRRTVGGVLISTTGRASEDGLSRSHRRSASSWQRPHSGLGRSPAVAREQACEACARAPHRKRPGITGPVQGSCAANLHRALPFVPPSRRLMTAPLGERGDLEYNPIKRKVKPPHGSRREQIVATMKPLIGQEKMCVFRERMQPAGVHTQGRRNTRKRSRPYA